MRKTILLVEDNPDDVELTKEAFMESGDKYRIDVARDGAAALDYFFGAGPGGAGGHELPSLILLDLKLPKIDGLEVLRRIRSDSRTQMIPVVVLTSSVEEEDIVKSYRLCCNSYLRKPLDFEEFLETVRQMEQYWLFLNVAPYQR